MRSKTLITAAMLGLSGLGLSVLATAPAQAAETMVEVRSAGMLTVHQLAGRDAFDRTCATCHGPAGAGQLGKGPPLIHKVYEPSHHGDMSFVLAARQGVRSHHWRFGNMPPQPGVTEEEIAAIIDYVRAVQRANGIN